MKKRLLVLTLSVATLLAGCGAADTTEEEVTLRSVEATAVSTDSISSNFAYSGKAAPFKEIAVMPTVPGKVTSYQYDVGDTVGSGAVLFTVDSVTLQNNLRASEASYAAAELGYDNAKKTYENNLILFESGILAEAEMDQIKYAYESAGANLNALSVNMDTIRKSIADCTVTAPMAGTVTMRNVEVGGFATQAAPSYTIMDLSTIKVEVGVSEQSVNAIKEGDQVSVKMTAASATPLTGTISTISPAAGATGTYTVKVALPNPDGTIRVGMLAEVSFTTEQSDDAIILPVNTVLTKDGETYVYTVEGTTAKKVLVETGIESGESIEILSGLTSGDLVITRGQTYVSDGEQVNISNAAVDATTTDTDQTGEEEKGE